MTSTHTDPDAGSCRAVMLAGASADAHHDDVVAVDQQVLETYAGAPGSCRTAPALLAVLGALAAPATAAVTTVLTPGWTKR